MGGVCTAGTKENFQLNIVHMNDIHAHFDEVSLNAGNPNMVKVGIFFQQRVWSEFRKKSHNRPVALKEAFIKKEKVWSFSEILKV